MGDLILSPTRPGALGFHAPGFSKSKLALLAAGHIGQMIKGHMNQKQQAALVEQAVQNVVKGYIGDPAQLAETIAAVGLAAKMTIDVINAVKNFLILVKKWGLPVLVVYLCLKFPKVAKAIGKTTLNAFWFVLKKTYHKTVQFKQNIEAGLDEVDEALLMGGKLIDDYTKKVCQLIVKLAMFMHSLTRPLRAHIYKEIGDFASRAKGKIFNRQTAAYIWNDWVKASTKSVLEKLKRAKSAIKQYVRKTPTREAVIAEKQVEKVIEQVEKVKTPLTPKETLAITQFAKSVTPKKSPTPYYTPRSNFTPRKKTPSPRKRTPTPHKKSTTVRNSLKASSSMRATPGSSPIRTTP
jgi:hypothetical protein